MINHTFDTNKSYSTSYPKKKALRITDKTIVVIDESLVKRLAINDDTWFEQELTQDGILLKICRKAVIK
jgi:hypothetical protein